MTSPSRLSLESTTRSSVCPQNGQRMRRRISHAALLAAHFARHVLPTKSLAREQQQSRSDDRQRADDVKQQGDGDRGIDIEAVKRRQDDLTGFVETADAARGRDHESERRQSADEEARVERKR